MNIWKKLIHIWRAGCHTNLTINGKPILVIGTIKCKE